jgi:predicted amidohydrolase YtcJ
MNPSKSLSLINGKFYLERDRFASSLRIEHGVIIGMDQPVQSDDHVIDLHGKTVVPAFNHSHLHLMGIALMRDQLHLDAVTSMDELIQHGQAFLKEHPSTVLWGRGYDQNRFIAEPKRLPHTTDLDQISSTTPVLLYRTCGHVVSVNSVVIERLHLSPETLQAHQPNIPLDIHGKPIGLFTESAIDLLAPFRELLTPEKVVEALNAVLPQVHAYGITSVHPNDLTFKDAEFNARFEGYQRFAQQQQLRLFHQIYLEHPDQLNQEPLHSLMFKKDSFQSFGSVKLYMDGSLGAKTASMREAYLNEPENFGIASFTQEELDERLRALRDVPVLIHAIGDEALERVLNAYEKVMIPGNPHRWGIVHVQISDQDQLKRMAHLNISAYVQPIFLNTDISIVTQRVSPELAVSSYAFGTMERLGIPVAFSSDAPIETMNVMHWIHCAVNRTPVGSDITPFTPQHAVDISSAIDACTVRGAYLSFEEHKKGRLAPGQWADLVVLSEDIFTVDPQRIQTITVELTMINGNIVYTDSSSRIEIS